jgi:glyoxalase family protein
MSGIHHVTAISGRADRNLDFYTDTLGMRLVKKTVNFDDPGTYHLYYGDEVGHPGTILTFFPWEHASAGRSGVGFAHQTAFRVPASSLGYWTHRLIEKAAPQEVLEKRFGESVLAFTDPDGMRLALVGVPEAAAGAGWSNGDVPAEHAIRGFHGVTLLLSDVAATGAILTDVLGYGAKGSSILPFRILAGVRWRPLRDCDRRTRFYRVRAGTHARQGSETTTLPRIAT